MTTSPSELSHVASEDFRRAMRHLTASVCLVTTCQGDERRGLTATAVCSVAAEPPTLLCCINQSASACAMMEGSGRFAINILAVQHQQLAAIFSDPNAVNERFSKGAWQQNGGGPPMLADAVAAIDCHVVGITPIATHKVFFGQVADLTITAGTTMLYGDGAYGALMRPDLPLPTDL